jgi:hypothetical protein
MGSKPFSLNSDPRASDIPSILVGELYARGLPKEDEVHRAWEFGAAVIVELFLAPQEACVGYRLTKAAPNAEEFNGRVHVSWTYPHLGGRRAWLHCTRRGCRSCAGIRYASKNLSKHARARTRADKIRRQLGGEPGHNEPVPLKPRGMHWKTYDRRRLELLNAEALWEQHVNIFIAEHEHRPLGTAISFADVPPAYPSLSAMLAHELGKRLDDTDPSTRGN